jgi:hypothetical protein
MNPHLSHALVALLLAAPALAGAIAGQGEPPAEAADHATHEAQDEHAGHAPAMADDPSALPATRWASDAPLREGMRRVRAATTSLSHAAHGHLDAGQVKAVSAELEAAVQDMIARCRLDPAPDAALHPLLARVLQASARLAGGEFDAAALADLEAVLRRYPLLFEDADWSADHSASA